MEGDAIRTQADHGAALAEIERLWDAPDGSDDVARMEVLAILVEDFEKRCWPMPTSSPLEILHYAISEMGRSQKELAELLGSRSRASELLNSKRRLTIDVAHRISTAWHIPAQLLIAPYDLVTAA